MESNLKVHVSFGYDYFYIDYSNNKIYASSAWNGKCDKFIGTFIDETDLKKKVAKYFNKSEYFYFDNPNKWDC